VTPAASTARISAASEVRFFEHDDLIAKVERAPSPAPAVDAAAE